MKKYSASFETDKEVTPDELDRAIIQASEELGIYVSKGKSYGAYVYTGHHRKFREVQRERVLGRVFRIRVGFLGGDRKIDWGWIDKGLGVRQRRLESVVLAIRRQIKFGLQLDEV